MALYTTQVRTICEASLGMETPGGFDSVNETLRKSAPLVFNFDFPIWDENYRLTLETKILKHYYMREIGFETVGLWKLYLDERLNLIMPYYNELYKTTVLDFNPYYDVDLTTEHEGDNKRAGTNTAHEVDDNEKNISRTGKSKKTDATDTTSNGEVNTVGEDHNVHQGGDVSKYSDTPQGSIRDLYRDRYLTNATVNSNNSTDDNNSLNKQTSQQNVKGNDVSDAEFEEITGEKGKKNNTKVGQEQVDTTEKYINHVIGANGNRTYSYKLIEFRTSIINIDKMIIDELQDLFLGLWG